ncbi:TetR/AcrR family transcriptional regulator [Bacillus sp. JCM 19034]|uniref:TetR/AcrR family transcriptional regulator n=1 Tax=Bacillus sp. JCM 19034 TaxID=1481928 RepID=UPI0007862157|nr:TetR/AcrR family transcriptional regulator [Bacillus sp. JCM 19034]
MDKRQLLIDAAYKVFSRKGFNNASIKDVAREAGITPGLVHYYFKNKEELLISVQSNIQEQYHHKYDNQEELEINPLDVLLEVKSRVNKEPDWYRWRYELFSLGLKGDPLKQEVKNILQSGRESLSHPLQKLNSDLGQTEALASILLSVFDGLALQKLIDDEFDLDQAYKLVIELLELYLNKHDD